MAPMEWRLLLDSEGARKLAWRIATEWGYRVIIRGPVASWSGAMEYADAR